MVQFNLFSLFVFVCNGHSLCLITFYEWQVNRSPFESEGLLFSLTSIALADYHKVGNICAALYVGLAVFQMHFNECLSQTCTVFIIVPLHIFEVCLDL